MISAISIFSFGYGFASGHFHFWPYEVVRRFTSSLQNLRFDRSDVVNQYYSETFDKIQNQFDIIFVGDSIVTAGLYGEYFFPCRIANRGIPGNKIRHVSQRIRTISDVNPQAVFLMVGVNDIIQNENHSDKIFQNYVTLVNNLSEVTSASIYIIPILPTHSTSVTQIAHSVNTRLSRELNYKEDVIFIDDIFSRFLLNDKINPQFSLDGVHPNGAGHSIIRTSISPYIQKHCGP